jgi:hypothetical protein
MRIWKVQTTVPIVAARHLISKILFDIFKERLRCKESIEIGKGEWEAYSLLRYQRNPKNKLKKGAQDRHLVKRQFNK